MKVAVTGANGQVGRSIVKSSPPGLEVHSWPHSQLDIGDSAAVSSLFAHIAPNVIINAAAYTAVDSAETDEGAAYRVNSHAVENLAVEARKHNARFIHISTDFVFDGAKSQPYDVGDIANPLNVYGKSKLDGEQRALEITDGDCIVLRTAWVYSDSGRNFVTSILKAARDGTPLKVVCDQVGSPTWAMSLAEAIWRVVLTPGIRGVLHWTDAGIASRYDLAVATVEEAWRRGLIKDCTKVVPIYTNDHATTAPRPLYSVLRLDRAISALELQPRHWRASLCRMLDEMTDG